MIHHINKLKNKIHIIISVDDPFMTKTLQRVFIEEANLNITKAIYKKATANIILNGEKLKTFPLRSGTRQGCPLLPLFFFFKDLLID